MCGILGIHRQSGILERDTKGFARAMERLRPRGPDGSGTVGYPGMLLGHRRLAILDPEQGSQPMVDSESGVTLSYNGEIYNFHDLRSRLEARGVPLQTGCDTEMVLKAYLEWGKACLDELEGMFAFAVYDPRREQLWLVRDRLGVKPLYFADKGDWFAFASSVAALLEFDEVDPVVDRTALAHYLLTIRTGIGDETLVRDVKALQPGETLTLRSAGGQPRRRYYWALPVLPPQARETRKGVDALAAEAAGRLDAAVQRQLISDVPLGAFLSGGLDSSVLAASIVRSPEQAFHTCSVGYREAGFNEWEHARKAARRHGIECREVVLSGDDFLGDWARLIAFKGLPLSTPNEVPIYRLAKAFGETCTVAMTGEGADELFGGYVGPTLCALDYDRAAAGPGPALRAGLRRRYGVDTFASRRDHFFRVNAWLSPGRQAELFLPGATAALAEVMNHYDGVFDQLRDCSTFDAYLHVHARVNLEGLLNRLDSSTMAASVEGRVPFTDHRLAAWLFSLPDAAKMALRDPGTTAGWKDLTSFELQERGLVESKRLLRRGYAGRVDAEILGREKMSFPVPFMEWFNGRWGSAYRQALAESSLLESLLDPAIRKALCREGGGRVDAMVAWPLMNLALMERIWGLRW
ncbi:MAG TPA: asparagine synthase (glutamine-hydrolyzing) [Oceanipulchritudo sp.]|nr:asparagine synthase (glutamine-hydrolyzing) [Oceanipulchritudo sp.]